MKKRSTNIYEEETFANRHTKFEYQSVYPMKFISRLKCRKDFPDFPFINESKGIHRFPKVFSDDVLQMNGTLQRNQFVNSVIALLDKLGTEELIFLPATNTRWLHLGDKRAEYRKALNYLQKSGMKINFEGGVVAEKDERKLFLKAIQTMTQMYAPFPVIYFIDINKNILGSLCQYHHLHLSCFNKQAKNNMDTFLKTSDLVQIKVEK